jgi:DNA-binding transcriptional ArsR family regulator
MEVLTKLFKMNEGDSEKLENGASAFFILTPDTTKPHFFFHYLISKEIASLSNIGANVNVLIMDRRAWTLDNELEATAIGTFRNHMREITWLLGGRISEIQFIYESNIIDDKKMNSNVQRLLSSLPMDDILQTMIRTDYALGNGFFDAAAIASLQPENRAVDFVVIGDHEKIAEYLMKNKLHLVSNRSVKLIRGHSLYTERHEKLFPYGLPDKELFMTDSKSILAKKVHSMTSRDVETAIEPFLTKLIDDSLARKFFTEDGYSAWKRVSSFDETKIKEIFLEYISSFSEAFVSACTKSADQFGIINLTSEGSSSIRPSPRDIFSALSNRLRLTILQELDIQHRPLSLREITLAVKETTNNNKQTKSNVYLHLKKLRDAGLVRIEENSGKYVAAFNDLNLVISWA